ncbi:MAG: hypothetical protein C0P65_004430 [Lysobacteraceae bacterium]|nr:hypothetical protein [Xanthomonadaceae bacterium]
MNSSRRLGLILGLLALPLFGAAAVAARAAGSAGHLPGLLAGMGCGLLFAAVLFWFTPGDVHDCAPPALARRYYREFLLPMAAYVVVMLFWMRMVRAVELPALRVPVALLPALLIGLAMRAVARYVRDSDEMQRRIELESIAIGAGATAVLYMTLGFLQSAGLIAVPAAPAMLFVFPALCVGYGLARLFVARRYL